VYRLDGGREVLFYRKRMGSVIIDKDTSISCIGGPCLFAKFVIESDDAMSRNSGKVILFDGVFFSIKYNNPTEHLEMQNIKSLKLELVDEGINEN